MYGTRVKIAFMLPSSCTVFEQEFLRMTAGLDGVIGVPARLLIESTGLDGLAEMNAGIDLAAKQLATTRPDVAVYMCTSGSFKDGRGGSEAIKERISDLIDGAEVTTTSEAVVEAMTTLGMRQVAMLTPYDRATTRREIAFLGEHGIAVTSCSFRNIEDNLDRGAVPLEESFRCAMKLDRSSADGIFLSCANVPAIDIVDWLESQSGLPVVTSSQATTWKALRLAGVDDAIEGYGRLLREY